MGRIVLDLRGQLPGSNWNLGRAQHTVIGITWHHTWCTAQAAIDRFMNPSEQVSANEIIKRDGNRILLVDRDSTSYADGLYEANLSYYNIEMEQEPNMVGFTDEQYRTAQEVAAELAGVYGFEVSAATMKPHRAWVNTSCPGDFDIPRVVRGETPVNEQVVVPTAPVAGTVYDSPTNDRSWLDYDTGQYVLGQIADAGTWITWDRGRTVHGKWLLHVTGGSWGLWDDCVDDGGFTPDHFAPPPQPDPVQPTPQPNTPSSVVPPSPGPTAVSASNARVTFTPTLVGGHPKEDRVMAVDTGTIPEPAPVAEAGVTTSEWRLALGLIVQLLVVGTTTVLAKAGLHLGQDVISLIATFEFLAIGVGISYIFGRSIRKSGTTAA